MAYDAKNSAVLDYGIKSARILVPFAIVANATPASKTYSSDLSAAMILSMEGMTAAATAADSGCNFTTPVDSTGIFGILVNNLGTVKKLLKVEVIDLSSGTVTVSRKGASSTGVTASGNIAVSVDSSVDLSSVSLSGTLCIDYIISKS